MIILRLLREWLLLTEPAGGCRTSSSAIRALMALKPQHSAAVRPP